MPRRKRIYATDIALDAIDWLKIDLVDFPPITVPLVEKLKKMYPAPVPVSSFKVQPWIVYGRMGRVNASLRDAGLPYRARQVGRGGDFYHAKITMYLCA